MKMILESKGLDTLTLSLTKNHLVVEHILDDVLIQHYMDSSLETVEDYIRLPITQEIYSSIIAESYEIKYKPSKVELYLSDVFVKQVDFTYLDTCLIPILDGTEIYDEVKATVDSANKNNIIQARLLMIGSHYKVRENEDYSNMKSIPIGVKFLLDMNKGWIL